MITSGTAPIAGTDSIEPGANNDVRDVISSLTVRTPASRMVIKAFCLGVSVGAVLATLALFQNGREIGAVLTTLGQRAANASDARPLVIDPAAEQEMDAKIEAKIMEHVERVLKVKP